MPSMFKNMLIQIIPQDKPICCIFNMLILK